MAWFLHEGKWHRHAIMTLLLLAACSTVDTGSVRHGDMSREDIREIMTDTESLGSFLDDLSGLTDEEKQARKALAKARKNK